MFFILTTAARPHAFRPGGTVAACFLFAAVSVSSQTPATPSIRVNTNIVVEDVTVLDSHGNPVHGLQQSQFTVTEDAKPERISHFEEHATLPPTELFKLPPMPKLDPGVFTNFTTVPDQEIGRAHV